MTHLVYGYPDVESCREIVDAMVGAGVDLIEIQLPFSDGTADGPTITAACQKALDGGARVADAVRFAKEMSRRHDVPFLFMSYFNLAFNFHEDGGARGVDAFARAAAAAGVTGLIVPDIPPEESQDGYVEACVTHGLHSICVTSPNVSEQRLEAIARVASGFVYCTSRTGTTGRDMEIEMDRLGAFLERARAICQLPLAVGFSISRRDQVEALRGKAEVAVVGSHLLRVYDREGAGGVAREVRKLREVVS